MVPGPVEVEGPVFGVVDACEGAAGFASSSVGAGGFDVSASLSCLSCVGTAAGRFFSTASSFSCTAPLRVVTTFSLRPPISLSPSLLFPSHLPPFLTTSHKNTHLGNLMR